MEDTRWAYEQPTLSETEATAKINEAADNAERLLNGEMPRNTTFYKERWELYCVKRLDNGMWCLLNRRYSPIGQPSMTFPRRDVGEIRFWRADIPHQMRTSCGCPSGLLWTPDVKARDAIDVLDENCDQFRKQQFPGEGDGWWLHNGSGDIRRSGKPRREYEIRLQAVAAIGWTPQLRRTHQGCG
ncbi:MAG: hypothetical protein KTV68_03575 [Acidimicrobiia bacterium]|nr:hypothetical protein [Acidimicrobiia bacterium]